MRTVSSSRDLASPSFFRLAAHPVRWRLLGELARSDRRVGELCGLLGRPQSLVSYHLGRLRSERVVHRRRSTADGRDSYYVLDLVRCGELLAQGGAALHPALRLSAGATGGGARARSRGRPVRVLFLCTGNSARSQIAEALAQQLGDGWIEARSAGSHPKPVHPNAVRVMRERGVDLSGRRSKPIGAFSSRRFDFVVSLCDRVREVCPEFRGAPVVLHWSIPDPASSGGDEEETYPAFRRVAAELETRIRFLLELIEHGQVT